MWLMWVASNKDKYELPICQFISQTMKKYYKKDQQKAKTYNTKIIIQAQIKGNIKRLRKKGNGAEEQTSLSY